MKLISNVGQAPRMYVMWFLALIAAVQGIWATLPADLVQALPPNLVHIITAVLAVAGGVARLVKQFAPDDFADTQPMEDRK